MLADYHTYPTIPAADLARARRFYEGTLGFKPSKIASDGVMYNANGSVLFLYPSASAGTNKATAVSFDVDNLSAIVKELRGKGVKFEEYNMPALKTHDGIAEFDGGKGAWFKDSEGNIVALAQLSQTYEWPSGC
jgi:catechol 2,3-dioxygenase-like lactoylglutathione lyase family enzyme